MVPWMHVVLPRVRLLFALTSSRARVIVPTVRRWRAVPPWCSASSTAWYVGGLCLYNSSGRVHVDDCLTVGAMPGLWLGLTCHSIW